MKKPQYAHRITLDPSLLSHRVLTIVSMRKEGLTTREIAERLDRSQGAVKSMLTRAAKVQREWGK